MPYVPFEALNLENPEQCKSHRWPEHKITTTSFTSSQGGRFRPNKEVTVS